MKRHWKNHRKPFGKSYKPLKVFAHPLKALRKPLKPFEEPLATRWLAVGFCPFNTKPLVYVFAWEVTAVHSSTCPASCKCTGFFKLFFMDDLLCFICFKVVEDYKKQVEAQQVSCLDKIWLADWFQDKQTLFKLTLYNFDSITLTLEMTAAQVVETSDNGNNSPS